MEFLNSLYTGIVDLTNSDVFNVMIFIIMIILVIVCIANIAKTKKTIKKYNSLMRKLGNGTNLETMLRGYITNVENIEKRNEELFSYCHKLDERLVRCIQKVGMVRYNAFEDTGSDLCFAIALLDYEDSGVVINGIYSREGSATYAKPVTKGSSTYTLSIEEVQAIDLAKRNSGTYFANV